MSASAPRRETIDTPGAESITHTPRAGLLAAREMRVLFVHTEQYNPWTDEAFFNLVRRPIVDCGRTLNVRDFVRNHRVAPIDLDGEG